MLILYEAEYHAVMAQKSVQYYMAAILNWNNEKVYSNAVPYTAVDTVFHSFGLTNVCLCSS